MKKWMVYVLAGSLMAGSASAAWWPFGSKKEECGKSKSAAPAACEMKKAEAKEDCDQSCPMMKQKGEGRKHGKKHGKPPVKDPAMKAAHAEVMALGEAARNETDPAKKEALVAQMKAKMNAMLDQVEQKNIAAAEQKLAEVKARQAEVRENRDQMVEKRVQKILSGEHGKPHEEKAAGEACKEGQPDSGACDKK